MMLALEMYRSLPRYVAARAVGGRIPGILTGPAAPVRLVNREEPRVSGPGWARVQPILSGICGSDLGALFGQTSLYFSALVSMPFVPGHEVVGVLQDDCEDLPQGTRVVLDPVLACAARGVERCESCARGDTNRCDRVTVGHVSPGLQTGYCADTGGGWGGLLVAHRSQLHPVPDDLSDERAVLVEPLACAVHTARRAQVPEGGSVLISGAGAVGLFATLAVRELTNAGRISVVAKYPRQRELAKAFGATDVLAPDEVPARVRRTTQAFRLTPERGGEFLLGGVDVAIDAVGSKESLNTVLRVTRAGGRVVLSGMPASGVDLSPVWFRELEVTGTYASPGREAFETAFELAATAPLDGVVGGRYPLYRWREALDHAHSAGRLGTVKVAFDVRSSR
ncbi:zinc-dependent alcohol dehydrogenase [Thermasporomyces composti]|jgi:threonine dehydrogenase-like Zn-dependent dehydrogenase|uniref:Threonine dehydrogenase-like Zn-dependent dehydrogenase n=1 Tax=Thermasporomyces composti TaxID=696763 RepID=A0A3D9UZU0_THECX|nr:zinc-binding dehydrogenase [Thermasporomyces composti]REF34787.1 threonine dehydrogenase-like Zn-dependent dehydrogenase [Thermasporomyces composti]